MQAETRGFPHSSFLSFTWALGLLLKSLGWLPPFKSCRPLGGQTFSQGSTERQE